MHSKRGRRRLVNAYLLGVASLLGVEGLAAGVVFWPPTTAVAGTPHPMTVSPVTAPAPDRRLATVPEPVAPPSSSSATPAPPVSSAPPPAGTVPVQAPGTVRLPSGALAHLVRQDVVDGVLPVPAQLNQAAWWGAALDAQRGATVFAGHVNWGGKTGPFAELWTARIGQEVTVVDSTGKSAVYKISQLFSLKKNELPERAPDLFAQTGAHRIVLVTCGGEWVGGVQGYAENRVVIADPA